MQILRVHRKARQAFRLRVLGGTKRETWTAPRARSEPIASPAELWQFDGDDEICARSSRPVAAAARRHVFLSLKVPKGRGFLLREGDVLPANNKVAIVRRSAVRASPMPHSQTCDTFRPPILPHSEQVWVDSRSEIISKTALCLKAPRPRGWGFTD
jgi:hypothetical protein